MIFSEKNNITRGQTHFTQTSQTSKIMAKCLSKHLKGQSRSAKREIFATPELVTARLSNLGPPAKGQPGPSQSKHLKGDCLSITVISIKGEDDRIRA